MAKKMRRNAIAALTAAFAGVFSLATVALHSNLAKAANEPVTYVKTDTSTGAAWEGKYGKDGYVVIGNTANGYYTNLYEGNDGKTEVIAPWKYNQVMTVPETFKEASPISQWDVGATVWASNNTVGDYKLRKPGTEEILRNGRLHNGWNGIDEKTGKARGALKDTSVVFTVKEDSPIFVTVNCIDWSNKVTAEQPISLAVFNQRGASYQKQPAPVPDAKFVDFVNWYAGASDTEPLATATVTAQTTYTTFKLEGAGTYQIVAYYDSQDLTKDSVVTPMFTGFFFDKGFEAEASASHVGTVNAYGSDWENSPYGGSGYVVLGRDPNTFYSNMYADNAADKLPAENPTELLTGKGWTNNGQNSYITVEGKEISQDSPIDQWAACAQVWAALPTWANVTSGKSLYAPGTTDNADTGVRFGSSWGDLPENFSSYILHKTSGGDLYVTLYFVQLAGSDTSTDISTDIYVMKSNKLMPRDGTKNFSEYYGEENILASASVTKDQSYVTFKLSGKGYFQIVAKTDTYEETKDGVTTVKGKTIPMMTAFFLDGADPVIEQSEADAVTGVDWEQTYGKEGYIVLDYDNEAKEKIAYTKGIYNKASSAYTGKVAFTDESLAYDAAGTVNSAPEWAAKDVALSKSDTLVSRFGMNLSFFEYKVWLDGTDAGNGSIYKSNQLKKPGSSEQVAVRAGGRNFSNEGFSGFAFTVTANAVANGGIYITVYHNNSMDGQKDDVNFNVQLFKEYHSTTLEKNRPASEAVETVSVSLKKNTHFYTTFKITEAGDYSIYVNPDSGKARGAIAGVFFDKTAPAPAADGTYNITYVVDGGTAGDNPATYTYGKGVAKFADAVLEGKEGTFKGWYQGATFGENTLITSIPAGMNADVTLYAKFARNVKLTYVLNGGTNDAANPTSVEGGATIVLKAPTAPEHYIFECWYKDEQLTDKIVDGKLLVPMEDTTIYAKFVEVQKFTITYVLDGGTNDAGNPEFFYLGEGVAALAPATKQGYTFEGWFTDEDFESEMSSIPASMSADVTLYAKFAKDIVIGNITYVLDGGTNATANPATYEEGVAVTLEDATKEGYTFDGWYSDAEFTNKITEIAATATGDVTVYAKFTKNAPDSSSDSGSSSSSESGSDSGSSSGSESGSVSGSDSEADPEEKGCGSSIAVGAVFAALSMIGAAILLKKKD